MLACHAVRVAASPRSSATGASAHQIGTRSGCVGSLEFVETMRVEVLLFDARPGGVFDAVSYTVFADGRLEVRLADGTVRTWRDDWMDVGPIGSVRPRPAKAPRPEGPTTP